MNECSFEGRLSGEPEARELPSGDTIVVFRIVVPRAGETKVDTIDCVAATAGIRRRVLALPEDVHVHVDGALHRRFFRAAGGVASRYEVEVKSLQRLHAAAPPPKRRARKAA